ncbi:MAG: DNA cytosine methyltransferase [Mesorhizobium sp.]|uniref:DNA cytosine methyltransferase n=1 Tax=Mesorhizobium sp. TaxID=1871066 RepID=UPI0011FC7B76|nr:DNA cytosine methyltransferase [Mesorhizobium sp.]TIT20144.1 MAG: DNA cytosine methyltransferase [Mesorhizobium sp.]
MLPRRDNFARIVEDEGFRNGLGRDAALNLDEHWRGLRRFASAPVDVIDMFSGCGGMSAGFASVNSIVKSYRIAMAVDIDADANETYAKNIGLQPLALDVARLSNNPKKAADMLAGFRTSMDTPLVLIGCAPCQGFSSHRNAAGQEDLRNSLFVNFAKIAVAVQPDVIVVENVPEILSDRYWPLVAEARRVLAGAGYISRIAIHDMAEFGVPQHRYRALLIAMRRPFEMPRGFLKRSDSRTVRDAIGHLPRIRPGEIANFDQMHVTANHRPSTVETITAVPKNGGSRPWHAGPDCLRRAEAKQGRAAYEDVYGRLWWDRPAITITAYARNPASGRYVHPEQHRGLSVREAALLQSFPGNYEFCGSFDSRFRQIGNAVPPAFAAYLATHLLGEIFRTNPISKEHSDITCSIGPSFSRLIPALKAGHRTIADRTKRVSSLTRSA